MIIEPSADDSCGVVVRGRDLVISQWPATGVASEVAPLHVHHADDEAWHVISGALRFRFEDREQVAAAGTTVLVPAGTAHTFGNAGPEPSHFHHHRARPARRADPPLARQQPTDHPAIYRSHASELLE